MYANADFDDDETRDTIFEYFIDKIYVYDDRLVITWYYSDNKSEVALDELTDITNAESISNEKGSTLTQSGPLYFPVSEITDMGINFTKNRRKKWLNLMKLKTILQTDTYL